MLTSDDALLPEQELSDLPDNQLSAPFAREPDPDNPSWGLLSGLLVWLVSVGLVIFVPVILLLIYAATQGITPTTPDYPKVLLEFAVKDRMSIILQVAALLPSHLITIALVWLVVTRLGKRPFLKALGWGWSDKLGLWSCIFLGIGLFLVATAIAKVFGTGKETQLEQIINSSLAARYLIAFFAVGTAPVVEEFVYRGVLYAPLQKLVGVRGAVVFVLALFTIIHVPQYWPNVGVIAAVGLLSVILTIVRATTKQLLPCVVIHLVFNGVQSVILIIEPMLRRSLPATPPVPSPSVLFQLIGLPF